MCLTGRDIVHVAGPSDQQDNEQDDIVRCFLI